MNYHTYLQQEAEKSKREQKLKERQKLKEQKLKKEQDKERRKAKAKERRLAKERYLKKLRQAKKSTYTSFYNAIYQFILDTKKQGCLHCNYKSEVQAVFAFHHIDPKDKNKSLSCLTSSTNGLDILREEYYKCILLCSNCHHEFHHLLKNEDAKYDEQVKECIKKRPELP